MSIPYTWIYLFYDPYTGLYKIGKSDHPPTRLGQLKSSNGGTIPAAPQEYQFREAWLCEPSMEKELHDLFAGSRVRGEWFDLGLINEESDGKCNHAALFRHLRTHRRWEERWTTQEQGFIDALFCREEEIARLEAENEVLRYYTGRSLAESRRKLLMLPAGDI